MTSNRRPASPPVEIEAKFRVEGLGRFRRRLRESAAERLSARSLETNTLFDRPDLALRSAGRSFRVRRYGRGGSVTLKGAPRVEGGIKARLELESEVGTPEVLVEILEMLGYQALFRYEKFRETWRLHRAVVCLDETPLGTFVEVEGAPAAIGRATRALGLSLVDSLVQSYPSLWAASGQAGDMVFPAVRPRSRRRG